MRSLVMIAIVLLTMMWSNQASARPIHHAHYHYVHHVSASPHVIVRFDINGRPIYGPWYARPYTHWVYPHWAWHFDHWVWIPGHWTR